MILFITSEMIFFVSFFWSFIHSRLSPNEFWLPVFIDSFNPFQIPLLNTLLLLSSGITVTVAHHSLIINNLILSWKYTLKTIILGGLFSLCQGFEYFNSSIIISEGVYTRIFYIATGFHGLHVLVGSTFLGVCLIIYFIYSSMNHTRFEFRIWYWHFVDLIWIFLYSLIYWWGV